MRTQLTSFALLVVGATALADNPPVRHARDGRMVELPSRLDRSEEVEVCVLPDPPPVPTPTPVPPPAPTPTPTWDDPKPELGHQGRAFKLELIPPAGMCLSKDDCEFTSANVQPEKAACVTTKGRIKEYLMIDGVLRYRLVQPFIPPEPRPTPAPVDTRELSRREAILKKARDLTEDRIPLEGYILKDLSSTSSAARLKSLGAAMQQLIEVLSKFQNQADAAGELTGTLADLQQWIASQEKREAAEAARDSVAAEGGTVFFEGELVLGGSRRTLFLNHDGTPPRGVTTDVEPIAPHEHLLFYLQRPGSERFQAKLESGDKKAFELISPALPNSSLPAAWVLERIGDATNFTTGKDIALTITQPGEKPEMVRQIAIPVIESYRWLVTTGLYFSNMPRRTYYISDVANGTTSTTQTDNTARQEVVPGGPTPTATPSDVTNVTNTTAVASGLKGVVALFEEGKPSPSAGIFVSYFLKPRVNRPGRVFRWGNLVPAIVLGAKADAPLQEGMLGFGFEPIRGVQIIGGLVKGRVTELGDGVELGKPLLVSTTIPTIHGAGRSTWFTALSVDVKPIAAELEKLLGRLF